MTSAQGTTVLVVDDEPMLREAMCEAFAEEGYIAFGACHGEDAIRCIANGHVPDAILLDLDMPIMDGVGFHEWLRAQPGPLASTPIVLVSASMKVREVAFALRVQGWLEKPVLPDAMIGAVERAIAARGATPPPRLRVQD